MADSAGGAGQVDGGAEYGGAVCGNEVYGSEVYGVVVLGGADVAVALSGVREVLGRPAQFALLPVRTPGLLGAVELRGHVVPVFDLRPRLGLPTPDGEQDAILIVSDGVRVLGVLAEQLRGVRTVPAGELSPLGARDADFLLSHTFVSADTDSLVSVLDIERVFALPGVFSAAEQAGGSAADVGRGAGDVTTVTVLQCGDRILALDTAHVHTTVFDSHARPSILASAICRGVTSFRERDIAVLDPLAAFGFGQLPEDHDGPGVVVEIDGGFVLLAVTKLISLLRASTSELLPVPALALARPDLITGMLRTEDAGDVIVLDGAAIRRDRELRALASVNVLAEPADCAAGHDAPAHGADQLKYSIGASVATPLTQISEILPYPPAVVATSDASHVRGVFSYRDIAVPVVCLATLFGRESRPVTPATCLLMVTVENTHIGYVIDSLIGVDHLSWHDDRAAATPVDAPSALRASPLVRVGDDDKLIPNLDLRTLTAILTGMPQTLTSGLCSDAA